MQLFKLFFTMIFFNLKFNHLNFFHRFQHDHLHNLNIHWRHFFSFKIYLHSEKSDKNVLNHNFSSLKIKTSTLIFNFQPQPLLFIPPFFEPLKLLLQLLPHLPPDPFHQLSFLHEFSSFLFITGQLYFLGVDKHCHLLQNLYFIG